MRLKLGARGSALSLAQATFVQRELGGEKAIELITVKTTGDRLSAEGKPIGWKGDFTKELDEALLTGRVDLAVHSLKDVPSELPDGLVLAAVPPREDPSDVLISRPRRPFAELPRGARVGTSSPRRQAQVRAARPDLEVLEARGNVDTRIRRLAEGRFDAIVLARAGLARLGRLDEIVEIFPESVLLPAVAQGAIGIVVRRGDAATAASVRRLDHPGSHAEALAERAFLGTLQAGCRAPVAGRARGDGGTMSLQGALGRALAEELLGRGAAGLIAAAGD
jgi:hydroxymethylbilane synthase